VARTRTGLHIYRVEKNEPPIDCKDQKMESKGFLPEIAIQDFPIRNQHVTLFIKRRRWEVKETGRGVRDIPFFLFRLTKLYA
ncbi:ISAon1 family transposase N-terminal region protein, partial [Larkinella harenae]